MHHWTDHNIHVHTQTCVFALMIAHLMRREATHAGLSLSVRELLAQLAGIGETILLYQNDRGRKRYRASHCPGPPHGHALGDERTPRDGAAGAAGESVFE